MKGFIMIEFLRLKILIGVILMSFVISPCAREVVRRASPMATIVPEGPVKASNISWYDNFGQSVALSGDTMVVGTISDDEGGWSVGAAWVFVREGTTWIQQAYIKPSTSSTGHFWFGLSVAISGDTMVVGAPMESSNASGINGNQNDNSLPQAGAAYVFVREGTTWSQQAYLKASNPSRGDQFGFSVAISGDTIVVGSRFESSTSSGVNGEQNDDVLAASGAAYVFVRNGVTWTQQAFLKASNNDGCCLPHADLFGTSVAISDDTIIVGAPGEDSSSSGVNGNQNDNGRSASGAAYIFVRRGTTWTQQAYLKASNPDTGDLFGESVAISGQTAVVGSSFESSNATGVNGDQNDNTAFIAGAAYVFVRNRENWSQEAYLKASNTEASDRFGLSLSVSGDTVVIGAETEDSNATGVNGPQNNNDLPYSGAAYVFARHDGHWTQLAYLKSLNTAQNAGFGRGIAISGNTIAVGAPGEDIGTGTVYIFSVLGLPPGDSDDDGVADPDDQCPGTPAGAIVDAAGCSIEQLVPCDGPWRNHGQFLRALREVTSEFVAAGLLTRAQQHAILLAGARSDCGKPVRRREPVRRPEPPRRSEPSRKVR
jgi:hypothetical protein